MVEQAPEPSTTEAALQERPHRVYTVSARTSGALDDLARAHAAALADIEPAAWASAAFTANTGRAHLEERIAVVAATAEQAVGRLAAAAAGDLSSDVVRGRTTRVDDGVVMLFTGQGSQVPGMGRRLYETEPAFRASLDESAEILRGIGGFDLTEMMFDTSERGRGLSIHDTRFTQPALFSYEVAMASLWRSWGLTPAAVMGHSIGEIAAAHVAGVMSLERCAADGRRSGPADAGAAELAAAWPRSSPRPMSSARRSHRGRTHCRSPSFNGPRNVVISGRLGPLEAVIAELEAASVRVVRLEVSHAFHSSLMDPMLDAFEDVVASIELRDPQIELISNRTGKAAEPGLLTSSTYWRDHVREAVRFEESVQHAVEIGYRSFLEVGPGPTLTGMVRACPVPSDLVTFASARRSGDEALELQRAAAALHVDGIRIDWKGYEAPWPRRPTSLPSYPFERQRFWHPRGAR